MSLTAVSFSSAPDVKCNLLLSTGEKTPKGFARALRKVIQKEIRETRAILADPRATLLHYGGGLFHLIGADRALMLDKLGGHDSPTTSRGRGLQKSPPHYGYDMILPDRIIRFASPADHPLTAQQLPAREYFGMTVAGSKGAMIERKGQLADDNPTDTILLRRLEKLRTTLDRLPFQAASTAVRDDSGNTTPISIYA
jgi:hypothetical protein